MCVSVYVCLCVSVYICVCIYVSVFGRKAIKETIKLMDFMCKFCFKIKIQHDVPVK